MTRGIGIITNRKKDIGLRVTRMVVNKLAGMGVDVFLLEDIRKEIGTALTLTKEDMARKIDFIISLGGDGTLLKTARDVCNYKIPVLGINLGSLGFLTEVETVDMDSTLEKVVEGKVEIQHRMVLNAQVMRGTEIVFEDIALNDVVLSRIGLSRILHVSVYVDDQYVDTFPGDGMIVSTPTGSTAYTLSAGGPIVQPDMDLMITTPICPHILYSRSFISADNKTIRLLVDKDYPDQAILTLDGQSGFNITAGDIILVSRSEYNFLFAQIEKKNFYEVLRVKIHDRRNRPV